MAPVNVETPATVFPAQMLAWTMPDDMLESPEPATDNMFSAVGPAPAVTVPLLNPDGSKLTDLETFDGSQRYFGSVFDNCMTAFGFAVPYLSGASYPSGVVLPDYNLDSDRGYAWPCWDVDWAYQNPMAPFPWNGCDPFPADTAQRSNLPGLRPGLTGNDPWGSPRHGDAWINATALGAVGNCQYADFPFPAIVVNPNRADLSDLDICTKEITIEGPPSNGMLTPDYRFVPAINADFLNSNPADPTAPRDDVVDIFVKLPYTGATTPENDGRLADFLRALARTVDPQLILANAVSLSLGGPTTPLPWGSRTIVSPAPLMVDNPLAVAAAQLAVTGRTAFEAFNKWSPANPDVVTAFENAFPSATFSASQVGTAAAQMLDEAYKALWAIRSNDPGWRDFRFSLGWIAVSGFDDTPHRPVNVPTAPYPQYDIQFDVPVPNPTLGGMKQVTSRFMVASAGTFVGPTSSEKSSFKNPDPGLLQAPATTFSPTPVPRTVPSDLPSIPAGNKIIVYIHGGGSRAEEAVEMANWFIIEGHAVGEDYTVVSFDLPNSAYGATFDVTEVAGPSYDHSQLFVLQFEQQYIIAFIEELDAADRECQRPHRGDHGRQSRR